jgi:hypothetical protein
MACNMPTHPGRRPVSYRARGFPHKEVDWQLPMEGGRVEGFYWIMFPVYTNVYLWLVSGFSARDISLIVGLIAARVCAYYMSCEQRCLDAGTNVWTHNAFSART